MTQITAGRASILGAQVVKDVYGTAMVLSAGTPPAGSAFVPTGCMGAIIYSLNVDMRIRCGNHASTALTNPMSGYLRANTEYSLPLNPAVNFISMVAPVPGTAQISWILGAGA